MLGILGKTQSKVIRNIISKLSFEKGEISKQNLYKRRFEKRGRERKAVIDITETWLYRYARRNTEM